MRKITMLWLLIFSAGSLFGSQVNPDKPKLGRWDFQAEKVFEIRKAGDEPLARPRFMLALEDGTLYIHDPKLGKDYIFDSAGRFLKSFAREGQGPGEVQGHGEFYWREGKLIVTGGDRIYYFAKDGTYLESRLKDGFMRRPAWFLDAGTMISSPLTLIHSEDNRGRIAKYSLETKEEQVLAEIEMYGDNVIREGEQIFDFMLPPLTPIIVVGCGGGRIYYGISDDYTIHSVDLEGDNRSSFSLKRKKVKIAKKQKEKAIPKGGVPDSVWRKMVGSLPDEIVAFTRIEVHNGLIYVYNPSFPRKNGQFIDIFSAGGEYLYKAVLEVEPGCSLIGYSIWNPMLAHGFAYIPYLDQNNEVVVAKYKIRMPKRGEGQGLSQ